MAYTTEPRTPTDDTILQYTAHEQRPNNQVELIGANEMDVKPYHDLVLSNPSTAGAVTLNLFNPIDTGYGKPSHVYEHRLIVKDLKGDSATNNITVKDHEGTTIATIVTNSQAAMFEIVNGTWILIGRMSV